MSIVYNEDLAEITGHFGTVHTLAFSPDGTSFASGSEDGYVHVHKFLPEYFSKRFEWWIKQLLIWLINANDLISTCFWLLQL